MTASASRTSSSGDRPTAASPPRRIGILSQVGLHWIDPADGAREIEGVPGTWKREGDVLEAEWEGEALELLADAPEALVEHHGEHTRVTAGAAADVRLARFGEDVQIDVIRRGDRIKLRLLDPSAPRRTAFEGADLRARPGRGADRQLVPRPTEITVGSVPPWPPRDPPGVAFHDRRPGRGASW